MAIDLSIHSTPRELVKHLFSIEQSDIDRVAARNARFFAYDGFNAEEIIKAFIIRAKAKSRSSDDVFNDLVDIVNIGLTRGNIRQDQLGRTHRDGASRIKVLAEIYGIELRADKKAKTKLSSETLTFTRSVSVFPFIASRLLQGGNAKSEALGCQFNSDELPKAMRHPGFSSLIPTKGTAGRVLFYAHCAFMVSFGHKINPNDQQTLKERFARQVSFSTAAWGNRSIYTDEVRITAINTLGLADSNLLSLYTSVANKLRVAVGKEAYNLETLNTCIKDKVITFEIVSQ
uniref:Nucleoprotein n=1 Tax=Raspberry rubodvirus 1 TaxID=3231632 RepID=A0AAU8JQ65_9VIRU